MSPSFVTTPDEHRPANEPLQRISGGPECAESEFSPFQHRWIDSHLSTERGESA